MRRDGWEVVETPKWPYRLSDEPASLTVATRTEAGETFQGNDWFSLGSQAEIGGKPVDVAPLVAAFLEQARKQALADALFDEGGGAADTLLDEATLQELFAPLSS